jgi:hypothetical protein
MIITADLLEYASLFLYRASPADIEQERQQLEAEHHDDIAVFAIEHPSHSGTICTRVTWQRKPST